MVQRDSSSPEAYAAAVPEAQRELFAAVRGLVHEAAPGTEETILYGMLGLRGVACLAAQVNYVSLYVPPHVLDSFRDRFKGAGKSCIRMKSMKDFNEEALKSVIAAAAADGSGGC